MSGPPRRDQALLALVNEEFALLILDIQMPDMTGFELAAIIKQRKRTAGVPIIFLTAYYNEDQHVLAGYSTGAVDYIQKPLNPAILRSKVAVFADLYRKTRELTSTNQSLLAEVGERRRAQDELRQLNQTLEARVVERTEALRHSEHVHRVAFDLAPTGMVYVAADGRFSKVNRSMCDISGYTDAELAQMKVLDLIHPDEREDDAPRLDAFLRGDADTYEGEKRCIRKDGDIRWVALSARLIADAETHALHSIWLVRDVSDRRAAQARLRESEERFRIVADQTPVVMWVTDPAGRIEFVERGLLPILRHDARAGARDRMAAGGASRRHRQPERHRRRLARSYRLFCRGAHAALGRPMAVAGDARRAPLLVLGRVPGHRRHEPRRHRAEAGRGPRAADGAREGRVHRGAGARTAEPAGPDPHVGRHPESPRDGRPAAHPMPGRDRSAGPPHGPPARRPARYLAPVRAIRSRCSEAAWP